MADPKTAMPNKSWTETAAPGSDEPIVWTGPLFQAGFATGLTSAGARERLELVDVLRGVDEVLVLEQRLGDMATFVAPFDARVAALAKATGEPAETGRCEGRR